MNKLICPDCRHENEPERVYCHNCGARLSGALLTKKEPAAKEETPAETRKRLQGMINPKGEKFRAGLRQVGKLIAASIFAAAIIEILSAPELPARREFKELGPQINLDLENAVMSHNGATMVYSEDDVNGYLAAALKRKKKDLDKPLLTFENGFANFDTGVIRFTASRSLFGYPLYSAAFYKVALHDGKLDAHNCGGALGRLPIHPALMKYADFVFADIWKALAQDQKQVAQLSAIEFRPKSVALTAPVR